ncbi:uncharacterized protein F5147DRAFT_658595 [Suillus discolor]|uniref:Uncharacterized protein n=1 Tax=Suillus discolor TaxID=1912936 RepID=A0A9P7EUH3_9AGAM|nr:uncharacterized protein F5147DRAFT_658595 [Suillus discolor]KAG2088849.1 hypothetical protein F5147DRAFT_658595 [Suillus discolor]
MPFPTSDPIVLEIKPRSKDDINDILCTFGIIMQNQTKTTQFVVGIANEEIVTVPDKCVDILNVVAHQHLIYREIASTLLKLPESVGNSHIPLLHDKWLPGGTAFLEMVHAQ